MVALSYIIFPLSVIVCNYFYNRFCFSVHETVSNQGTKHVKIPTGLPCAYHASVHPLIRSVPHFFLRTTLPIFYMFCGFISRKLRVVFSRILFLELVRVCKSD